MWSIAGGSVFLQKKQHCVPLAGPSEVNILKILSLRRLEFLFSKLAIRRRMACHCAVELNQQELGRLAAILQL